MSACRFANMARTIGHLICEFEHDLSPSKYGYPWSQHRQLPDFNWQLTSLTPASCHLLDQAHLFMRDSPVPPFTWHEWHLGWLSRPFHHEEHVSLCSTISPHIRDLDAVPKNSISFRGFPPFCKFSHPNFYSIALDLGTQV